MESSVSAILLREIAWEYSASTEPEGQFSGMSPLLTGSIFMVLLSI